ncbi:glycerate kinase [Nocardiopsis sp. ARC36]
MSTAFRTHDEASPLRVAIIPDSFKGSAGAVDVAAAMARGVQDAFDEQGTPVAVRTLPFADGGEGTLDALLGAWGTTALTADTTDALGRPVRARYGLSPDHLTGVIEAAEANGLPAVSDVPLRPLTATTRGIGPLVASLLDAGVEEILLCIGGSATTDGGTGLLAALGRASSTRTAPSSPTGRGTHRPRPRRPRRARPPRPPRALAHRLRRHQPLLGDEGAAAVFGPQKGASPEDVRTLDAGLRRLADVLAGASGTDVRDLPGMGAAGGLPAGLTALLGAEVVPGSRMVADVLGAEELLSRADLVLTGEGSFDGQSLAGKVVDAVRRLTPADRPVVVIAGRVAVSAEELRRSGITAAFSIARGPGSLEQMQDEAIPGITWAAYNCCRLLANSFTRPVHP